MFKEKQIIQELGLKVKEGITQRQIDELIHFSQTDPEITQTTSDQQRFSSRFEFDKWRAKGRRIYVLGDIAGNLKGIIWFGQKEPPKRDGFTVKIKPERYNTTFAIRLYENARGKGLAFDFMFKAFVLDWFHWDKTDTGIWLDVSESNTPAVKLYRKFGFRKVTVPDENGKIFMVWHDLKWHLSKN